MAIETLSWCTLMIYNIKPGTFGGKLRMGDLVAVCNVVEYIRKRDNDPTVKFKVELDGISEEDHCRQFYFWLCKFTNYMTVEEGSIHLPWLRINLWDFRDISGDMVSIPNLYEMKKKIVIFPLFDAPYNQYRNWPRFVFDKIRTKYSGEEYKDYEKIVCSKDTYYYSGWITSTSILDNLKHIQEAEIFVGGDTGTTHFAFALDRSPKELVYMNSSRALVHTLPFYLMQGKGQMGKYWLDFEGTSWQ